MNVERRELVNIMSESTIQDIVKKWVKFGINITREDWLALANKVKLFVTNKIRTFYVLFNLKAFMYNNVISKYSRHSNLCRLCKQDIETWKHVYWDCSKAKMLWDFIYDKIPDNMKGFITYENVFLGLDIPDWLLVLCTLVKWFLHCSRFLDLHVDNIVLVRLIRKHVFATKNFHDMSNRNMSRAWSTLKNMDWLDTDV